MSHTFKILINNDLPSTLRKVEQAIIEKGGKFKGDTDKGEFSGKVKGKYIVFSEDNVYEYRVEKVYRAKAQDLTVPIAGTGNRLTLATCNSFGSVDDRYIVEAKRISTYRI